MGQRGIPSSRGAIDSELPYVVLILTSFKQMASENDIEVVFLESKSRHLKHIEIPRY
jgi:hypothetical protein